MPIHKIRLSILVIDVLLSLLLTSLVILDAVEFIKARLHSQRIWWRLRPTEHRIEEHRATDYWSSGCRLDTNSMRADNKNSHQYQYFGIIP